MPCTGFPNNLSTPSMVGATSGGARASAGRQAPPLGFAHALRRRPPIVGG